MFFITVQVISYDYNRKVYHVIFVQEIIAEVPGIILRCLSRDEAALAVAQKVWLYLEVVSDLYTITQYPEFEFS